MSQKLRSLSRVVEEEKLKQVVKAFKYALGVVEKIKSCRCELDSLVNGLSGSYVSPSPSGSLTRGRIDVLPTGRNFYLVDPRMLPTPAAWEIGKKTAKKLVNYYLEKHGRYPESIGEVLWSIDAYKADGEQLSQILYLIGVEPLWRDNGIVDDVRVIPLDELGRPRIDVVVRISGIVRDTLPNYVELIDKAITKVLALDEPLEFNYVRKHYFEYLHRLLEAGVGKQRAEKIAKYRVFGSPPGTYGSGVNLAVEASAWENQKDLAEIWIQWSSYAYGIDAHGDHAPEALVLGLEKIDVVNRNHVSDEHDPLNCCCYFSYHGGFYNAAKTVSGKHVEVVVTDTRSISRLEVRSLREELERVSIAKILNKEWISHMKKHGYRGASEVQRKILHLYGWASTTRQVPDSILNKIAETYVLDKENREWFIKHNIWALEEITRRLIEAAIRNVWKPPEDLLEKIQEVYSEIEGYLEDNISSENDIQGGLIEIVKPEQVDSWREKILEIERVLDKLGKGRA